VHLTTALLKIYIAIMVSHKIPTDVLFYCLTCMQQYSKAEK